MSSGDKHYEEKNNHGERKESNELSQHSDVRLSGEAALKRNI